MLNDINNDVKYYELLNIDINSDMSQIKKAYRQLSIKYHPDKNSGNSELFKKITAAYEYLLNKNNNHECKNNINSHALTSIIPDNINNNSHNYNLHEDIHNNITITFEQSFLGANIPINITRKIFINNTILSENETIYIKIPKGIDHNEIIILEKKGNFYKDFQSNIKIIINLKKHNCFDRNGLDLIYNKQLSFKDSLVGFSFILKHLNNKCYKISNIKGELIHNKSSKILADMGFDRDGYMGNLIINFNINYPDFLSDEIISKLKEIL
tara:strand:+ start:1741 stop:2547 length:807 start_codon:yes stop_codon:yes gene_type:complete